MDKEEKIEWLPASEWNDAAEKRAGAKTWLDSKGRDHRPPEERSEPIDPSDRSTYPKELTDALLDPLSVYDGLERFQIWVNLATKPLFFPPDRKRVKQEFTEHFEERVETLTEHGASLGEARKQAVKMLGDPAETGELLRVVHKPWLGWLLRLFRLAVAVLLIAVTLKLIDGTDNLRFLTKHQVLQEFSLADKTMEDGTKIQITSYAERSWTGGEEIQFGGFTVSCEDVIYRYRRMEWFPEDYPASDPDYGEETAVLLRLTGAPWGAKLPRNFDEYVRIVDDNGVVYNCSDDEYYNGLSQHIRVIDTRVLPWAYVVCIDFHNGGAWPDDAKRLDIYLGKGEATQKISVWLGDWTLLGSEDFPGGDAYDAARWETILEAVHK